MWSEYLTIFDDQEVNLEWFRKNCSRLMKRFDTQQHFTEIMKLHLNHCKLKFPYENRKLKNSASMWQRNKKTTKKGSCGNT